MIAAILPPPRTTAGAWARLNGQDVGWLEHLLPMPLMPLLACAVSFGFSLLPLRALIGRVRGGRLVGILRVARLLAFKLLDTLDQLWNGFFQRQDMLLKRRHIPAHRLRSSQPVRLVEVLDVVADVGKTYQALAGWADGRHPHALVFDFLLDTQQGFEIIQAPDVLCTPEKGFPILDEEIDRLGGPTRDDDGVEARELELGAEEAAGLFGSGSST